MKGTLLIALLSLAVVTELPAQRAAHSRVAAAATDGAAVRDVVEEPISARRKNGFIAFAMAYTFPGLGHFYVGESWRGATVLGTVIGGMMLMVSAEESNPSLAGTAFLSSYIVYLWSIVDAPFAARRHNRLLEADAKRSRP